MLSWFYLDLHWVSMAFTLILMVLYYHMFTMLIRFDRFFLFLELLEFYTVVVRVQQDPIIYPHPPSAGGLR